MPIHTEQLALVVVAVVDITKDDPPAALSPQSNPPPRSCPACQSTAQCRSSCRSKEAISPPSSPATLVGDDDEVKMPPESVHSDAQPDTALRSLANDTLGDLPSRRSAPARLSPALPHTPRITIASNDSRRKQRTFSTDSQSSRPTLYSPTSSSYHISPPPASPTLPSPSSVSRLPSKPTTPSPRSPSLSQQSSSRLSRQPDFDPYVDITRLRIRSRGMDGLYPGAVFGGTQKSGRTSYEVTVTIVDVDLDSSYLCGYLKIRGLTDDWPELTTYFDAEIIGERYGFLTQNWGASESQDMTHWGRFPAFRHVKDDMKRPMLTVKDSHREQRGVVFMRWKERFLVPDHRVKDINGASFAGFYYVCVETNPSQAPSSPRSPTSPSSPRDEFDLGEGHNRAGNSTAATMTGFYYHQNSEPYQQLCLQHLPEPAVPSYELQ